MADFLLLYSGGSMPEDEAQTAAVMEAWNVWYGKLGEALVDGGNPYTPMAKSIDSDGMVSDGPMGPMATGYTIVKAGSLDEAVGLAKGCPVLQGGGQITVYKTFPVMPS
jgi:hypothetical protein